VRFLRHRGIYRPLTLSRLFLGGLLARAGLRFTGTLKLPPFSRARQKPDISTLPECGHFYLALTLKDFS
jgi:hypothetical protein